MALKRNSDLDELTTLADGDNITVRDVSDTTNQATGETKRSSWTSIKAFLKTYFDTLYNKYVLENHATKHVNGTDDIQNATNAQKGLATAAQITTLENNTNAKNYTESPMVVTGGAITEGTNAGTFKVAALTCLLRATNSLTGALTYLTLAEQDNQAITAADTTYFVCLNYNDGVTPTISLSETNPYKADKRNIPIGKVMKDVSDNVHFISGGYNFQDGVEKLHVRAKTLRSLELNGGSAIAYSGTNNFTMDTGIAFGGLNEFSLSAYNSATTTFTPIYSDGGAGFTEGAASNVIDFAHYDDGSGTLNTVGNNKFSNHYIYKHIDDNDVYIRYGEGSYTLAEAVLNAVIPPVVPTHLNDFGCLIGCVVAPQLGGEFTKIVMVTSQFFSGAEAASHANLSHLDYADSKHTGFAKSGADDTITSLTALSGQQTIPSINLTGGQMKFPATAVPSSDPNTLDDYEEGTWTPVYLCSATQWTSITMDTTITGGRYTKIGNKIFIQGGIRTDALTIGAADGGLQISGFPFTSANKYQYGGFVVTHSYEFAANNFPKSIQMLRNATTADVWKHSNTDANGPESSVDVTSMKTAVDNNDMQFTGSYMVD